MSNIIDTGNRISCSLNVEQNKNINHNIKAKRKNETAKNIFTTLSILIDMYDNVIVLLSII